MGKLFWLVQRRCTLVTGLAVGALLAGTGAAGPAAVAAVHADQAAVRGSQLWAQPYNGPGNGTDEASSVVVSPNGRWVYVTGRSAGTNLKGDYATIAYNAVTGAKAWVSRYNGPGNGIDYGVDVLVSPDGKTVYVSGDTYGGKELGREISTIAYNAATGSQLWVSSYDNQDLRNPDATRMAVDPDGSTVFVTGQTEPVNGGRGVLAIAYDAVTGAQLWANAYNPPGAQTQTSWIGVSPDASTVYLTGEPVGYTVAIDAATGAQKWMTAVSTTFEPTSQSVSQATGTIYVAGFLSNPARFLTVAYNPGTGAQLWQVTGPAGQASSLAVSGPDVIVTGTSHGTASSYETVAYNAATGAKAWIRSYKVTGHPSATAYAIVASADGQAVYVTGRGGSLGVDYDFATVAYAAGTGTQLWARQYSIPDNQNAPAAIAIGPQGRNVYVTGYSRSATADYDYTTVAYKA